MKVLAINTATTNCSVCVMEENKVVSEFDLNIGVTHSQNLLPMIDTTLKFSNIDISDIDVFACSIGPGSFTGLRIGLATIKGFAISLDKKVIGIPTLFGLANNVSSFDGIICSVLDAKNNNVYAGIFKSECGKPKLLGDYITENVDFLIEKLLKMDEKVLFIGDGSVSFKDNFNKSLKDRAFFAPIHLNNERSSSIASLALDRALMNDFDDYDTLVPMYLKKSQAERLAEG